MLFGVLNLKAMEPKFILIFHRRDKENLSINSNALRNRLVFTEYVKFFNKEDIEEYLNTYAKLYNSFSIIGIYEIKQELNYEKNIVETIEYKIV